VTVTDPTLTVSPAVGAVNVSDTPAGLAAASEVAAEGDGETRDAALAIAGEGEGEEAAALGEAEGLAAALGFGAAADDGEVAIGGVVCVGVAIGGAAGAHAPAPTARINHTLSESV
jgi:hypothetical protein